MSWNDNYEQGVLTPHSFDNHLRSLNGLFAMVKVRLISKTSWR